MCGPTGIGKSSLAVKIAAEVFPEKFEIISSDSAQVYRYLNIGTGKITKRDMKNVPHYMIDIVDPDSNFDAADFVKRSIEYCSEIKSRGKIPFFVGGTGLYLSAFFEGLSKVPDIPKDIRETIKNEIVNKGSEKVYENLLRVDPLLASKINKNDKQRIVRGLEVYLGTGKKLSDFQNEKVSRLSEKTLFISLDENREDLYSKINNRVDEMIQEGFESEVSNLLEKGYSVESQALRSIGYSEMISYLNGIYDFDKTVYEIKRNSRKYAKKQLTWFRGKYYTTIYDVSQKDNIYKRIDSFLKK